MARANRQMDMWQGVAVQPVAHGGPPRWLLSFVDLTGILVAFFVLMFSMREMDLARYEKLQNAMHKAFISRPSALVDGEAPAGRLNAVKRGYQKNDGVVYLQNLLARRLEKDPFWSTSQPTTTSPSTFELVLPPSLLNEKELTPVGNAALARLAAVVRNWDNVMYVTVHATGKEQWDVFEQAMALRQALQSHGVAAVGGVQFKPAAGPTISLEVQQL